MRSAIFATTLSLVLLGCSGGDGEPGSADSGTGADTPDGAVSQLLDHLRLGDFTAAVPLAVPGQAALASLAEGAPVEDVALALREGDEVIANNFWAGFAQTVEPSLLEGPEINGVEPAEAEGVDFNLVLVGGSDVARTFTTRDVEGHRVDLFATFGPSLASRLYAPVERLFASTDDDAVVVLGAMRDQVPSLHMASLTPGLAPNVVQDLLQLIELITRIN